MRETDVNVVVLFGDRAYKLKKPVTTDLLDLGTPERRLAACRREVELNRRLAPDVYLGISSVTDPVDPDADPGGAPAVEHVVVMRRMPEDRRLSHLVRAGAPVEGPLRALARTVAVFHAAAPHDPEVTAEGSRDAVLRRWAALVAEVRATRVLAPDLVDAVERLAGRFLAGRAPLIAERCADDRIVDGHGDLIADDVFCLDDGPRVLDCLEFDDRLRYVDGLDDAAFLAMDLERLGRPELATAWLDAYAEFSGDPAPAALRHHYVAYRAFVRAKAACLRSAQGDPGRRGRRARARRPGAAPPARRRGAAGARRRAAGHRQEHRRGRAGRPGRRRAAVRRPRLRKELAGQDPETTVRPRVRRGGLPPRPAPTRCTQELLHRAGALLERGESVVIDASWIRPSAPRGGRRAGRAHPQRARRPALRRAARHRPPAVRHARALDLVRHHGHRGRDGRGLPSRGRRHARSTPRARWPAASSRRRWPGRRPCAADLQPPRTTATGQWAWCSSCWLTEPRSRPRSPPRPREPTTTS